MYWVLQNFLIYWPRFASNSPSLSFTFLWHHLSTFSSIIMNLLSLFLGYSSQKFVKSFLPSTNYDLIALAFLDTCDVSFIWIPSTFWHTDITILTTLWVLFLLYTINFGMLCFHLFQGILKLSFLFLQ